MLLTVVAGACIIGALAAAWSWSVSGQDPRDERIDDAIAAFVIGAVWAVIVIVILAICVFMVLTIRGTNA